jgi:Ser/Thr protein kinase RdoA (MazF antagonist)
VARHLPTAAAEETELGEDGVTWAAFEHIEGREYNFSIEDAVQAARRLGEFHVFGRDLAGIAPPLVQRPSIRDCWLNAETDLEGLRELFADVAVQDELQYLEDWWRFVGREWPLERFDALPSGLVHGDFHGRNTAYAGGELVGIFDFDDVEPAPFVHDLAGSAYKFGRESRFVLTPRADVVHAFIETYATIRPLSAEERAALPVMMAMSYPPNPRYYLYYRNHHGSNLVNRLHREVGVMRMLRGEAASIFGASFS